MQVAKAFEIVPLDETVAGDILHMNGCWALRLDCGHALYLNGQHQGIPQVVIPQPCLRLKDYDGIVVEFENLSYASSSDLHSKNPLVVVDQGYALVARIDGEDKFFNFAGKETAARPAVQTGPWMATAVVSGSAKSLRLF
ncbi:hypothetical protein [Lelliottia jeotgali]